MSTIDTSTWNPDADLNVEIEGIPLNANASIQQTWQALRVLMAAVKGDGDAIKAMIDVMQGATASADGVSGLVPKPEAGDQDKFLKGDGTWDEPTDTTYSEATATTAGLMSASDKSKLDGIASGAQANVIEAVMVNGAALAPSSKIVSIPNASTAVYGCTKLSSATNSMSTSLAATASAVKAAYDLANGKQSPATTIAGYGITDAYTKTEIDSKLTSAMHYKGSVATVADLPSSNNQTGDFYNVTATGENYAWTGSAWDVTGSIVDLAAITNGEIDTVVAS